MRFLKLALISLPLVLAGCLDFDDDQPIYHPTPAPAAPVAAPNPPAPPADCCCPGVDNAPQPCPCPGSGKGATPCPCPGKSVNQPADPNWHPSEGHLVRAGELVMEQQRQNGNVRPSHAAMASYLQAHMQQPFAVTAGQAERILEEMGL